MVRLSTFVLVLLACVAWTLRGAEVPVSPSRFFLLASVFCAHAFVAPHQLLIVTAVDFVRSVWSFRRPDRDGLVVRRELGLLAPSGSVPGAGLHQLPPVAATRYDDAARTGRCSLSGHLPNTIAH